jgi:hypothetical protein
VSTFQGIHLFLDFLVWSGQTIFKEVREILMANISEAKAQLSALIEQLWPDKK